MLPQTARVMGSLNNKVFMIFIFWDHMWPPGAGLIKIIFFYVGPPLRETSFSGHLKPLFFHSDTQ